MTYFHISICLKVICHLLARKFQRLSVCHPNNLRDTVNNLRDTVNHLWATDNLRWVTGNLRWVTGNLRWVTANNLRWDTANNLWDTANNLWAWVSVSTLQLNQVSTTLAVNLQSEIGAIYLSLNHFCLNLKQSWLSNKNKSFYKLTHFSCDG